MLYTDFLFLLFFGGIWLVSRLLNPWPTIKEWLLIACSLLLVGTWGAYDLVLFLSVLLANYAGAWAMVRSGRRAGAWLALLIALDLGTLAFFKYFNFFLGSWLLPRFPLGIPLAISFYTFHLVSYLVDLRAGKIRMAGFREYLFYLCFFPHVIAGPIVRAWQLVPQIGKSSRRRLDLAMGIHYLTIGFFFKAIVANNIAEAIDPVWNGTAKSLHAWDYWATAFLYYCQIYGDFAGYTLMALGMARLLGYRLPPNFRAPMLAASLREFWQRWHITLSRWLRDYLYIPLGGNRVSPWRSAVNVLVTMILGGLWHGAGWGFIVWGAMHGAGLAAERLLGKRDAGPARWLATQAWVCAAWVFFRAPTLSSAGNFFHHMVPAPHWRPLNGAIAGTLICAIPIVIHHAAPALLRRMPRRSLAGVLGIATGIALALNILLYSPVKAFIYFRF